MFHGLIFNEYVYEGIPVITPEMINETLIEGDTALFRFKSTGAPIPTLSWYFNGAPVEKANDKKYMISEMSFNPITKNTTLTIMNLELSDVGTYTCSATNIVSGYTSYGVLSVNGEFVQYMPCTLLLIWCVYIIV